MSLSKEAKALRVALQAAGVSVDACAQTLMVAAAKYIEERTHPAEADVPPSIAKLTYPEEVAAEISKPAKPKAKKSK